MVRATAVFQAHHPHAVFALTAIPAAPILTQMATSAVAEAAVPARTAPTVLTVPAQVLRAAVHLAVARSAVAVHQVVRLEVEAAVVAVVTQADSVAVADNRPLPVVFYYSECNIV